MGTTIIDKFRRGLLIALSLGVLVYLAYALWAGWDEAASALVSFDLRWLPLLLLLLCPELIRPLSGRLKLLLLPI